MRKVMLSMALLALAASGAEARTHLLSNVGMKVDIPDQWKTEIQNNVLTASTPVSDLAISIFEPGKIKDLAKAIEQIDEELDQYLDDIEVSGDEVEPIKVNGFDVIAIDGTGTAKGNPVEWSLSILHNGKGKFLVLFGFARPNVIKKYEDQLIGILQSFAKA